MGLRGIDWNIALLSWERVAGSFLGGGDSESRQAFNHTITADCWTTEPLDWRKRAVYRPKRPRSDEDREYTKTIDEACIARRFFVTRDGRFVLGPWDMERGDTVSILLGGNTFYPKRMRRERGKKTCQ